MLMEGFSMVFGDPLSIVLVAAGTLIGTIFGAIPGLTATMAVTICLPMTFAMSDNRAIALLMALYIGGISGGLVSSILLNIPGTPASMVTAFDGAPMARKGEGAKALGTGIFFSFLGTIFGLIALMIIAPYLAAVAIKFGAFSPCRWSFRWQAKIWSKVWQQRCWVSSLPRSASVLLTVSCVMTLEV